MKYKVKNGKAYVTIDGKEYELDASPYYNKASDPWANAEGMSRNDGELLDSISQGVVDLGGNNAYILNNLVREDAYSPSWLEGGSRFTNDLAGERSDWARNAAKNDRLGNLWATGVGGAGAMAALGPMIAGAAGSGATAGTATGGLTPEYAAMLESAGLGETAATPALAELGGASAPYFDAAAGWIDPATGSVISEAEAMQALTPLAQAGDASALGQLTNYANTMGGANVGSLAELTSKVPFLDSIISKLPSSVTSMLQGLKGNDILSILGSGILNNYLSNRGDDNINQVWDQVVGGIAGANQLRDLAPVAREQLSSREGLDQALAGLGKLSDLTANPISHPGYSVAATGSRSLQDLYNDPMSNPMIAASTRLMEENASRRSAAGRGLQAGSYPAELQDAILASISGNFGNLAGGYSKGIDSGSNFYKTSLAGLGDVISGGRGIYDAGTSRGNASANAANAHLAALGNAASGFTNPMIKNKQSLDPAWANLRTIFGGY